jgi:hypothetical protein
MKMRSTVNTADDMRYVQRGRIERSTPGSIGSQLKTHQAFLTGRSPFI